jgi:hypothetical protein
MCQSIGMDEIIFENLLLFIASHWKLEFHIHINASKFALIIMFVQNSNNTINKLIYYVNRLMTRTKKNYTAIQKETLVVIYAMKKFHRYLLGNLFILYVDHQGLLHLVIKLVATSKIT